MTRWPVWRKALWLVVAAAVVWLQGADFVRRLRPDRSTVWDFFQEYASARNYWEGFPIYTDQETSAYRYLQVRRNPEAPLWLAYNGHPPAAVLLAVPLARLDYPTAMLAWNLLSLAALAGSIGLVIRQLRVPFCGWDLLPLVTLLLLFSPLARHLLFGQLSLVLAFLITAAWALLRSGWRIGGGVLLGAAAAIKLFPAFLFIYPLARRDGRALLGGAAGVVLLSGLAWQLFGTEAYRDYLRVGLPQPDLYRSSWDNASAWGFLCKLFHPADAEAYARAAQAAGLKPAGQPAGNVMPLSHQPALARLGMLFTAVVLTALSGWAAFRWRSREGADLAFSISVVAMLLVTPIAWDHYLLMLIVPAAVLMAHTRQPYLSETLLLTLVVAFFLAVLAALALPALSVCVSAAALLAIGFAAASPWIPAARFPRSWVLCCVAAALAVSPALTYEIFTGGMLREQGGHTIVGTATPLASLTVLSAHFYSLIAMFVLGWVIGRSLVRTAAACPVPSAAVARTAHGSHVHAC